MTTHNRLALVVLALVTASSPLTTSVHAQSAGGAEIPVNFKIAFIGDSEVGTNTDAVLNLILSENADMVVHAGDLDYTDDPLAFEASVNDILGQNFPYVYSAGNHDAAMWFGPNGYQDLLQNRFNRIGLSWSGDLGAKSNFVYNGIFFLAMAPNEVGIGKTEAADYIRDQLAANDAIWSVVFWHKNQQHMQVGGKPDEVGWAVYEEARAGGGFIATGHEHSYSRTYLMSEMESMIVASQSDTLALQKDDPATPGIDEGRSFAFVSGLAGKGIRNQKMFDDHWAAIYSSTQGADYGALFGEFNYNGQVDLARFYFKDINGHIPDSFFVRSEVEPATSLAITGVSDVQVLAGEENVFIRWSLASPVTSSRFGVELNSNGRGFVWITDDSKTPQVADDGRYVLTVAHPGPGVHAYRLFVRYADGTTEYSEPVTVSIGITDSFVLTKAYPNPAADAARFDLSVASTQQVRIELVDMVGRTVRTVLDETVVAGSENRVALYTADLPGGVYFYRARGETFVASRSIIVTH